MHYTLRPLLYLGYFFLREAVESIDQAGKDGICGVDILESKSL
jgi:hypothetical protein